MLDGRELGGQLTELTVAEFQAMARDPRHWQRTARDFSIAANYLGDWYDADSDRFPADMTIESQGSPLPMMVLYAAAVENLLKGIRVARGHDPVASGTLDQAFANHDLLKHARLLHLVDSFTSSSRLNCWTVGAVSIMPRNSRLHFSRAARISRRGTGFEYVRVSLSGACPRMASLTWGAVLNCARPFETVRLTSCTVQSSKPARRRSLSNAR